VNVGDAEKAGDLWTGGVVEDVGGWSGLDQTPFVENEEFVGEEGCLFGVVGDDDGRGCEFVLECSQMAAKFRADVGIEG